MIDQCPGASRLLEWLRDVLPSEELRAVEAHIDGCATCQAALDDILHRERVASVLELPSRETVPHSRECGINAPRPAARVVLTITRGAMSGQRVAVERPDSLVVGRAEDCRLRLPGGGESAGVSRHHCQFDIDPPVVRVRDLGSRNGTFVNRQKVGQGPGQELKDGDEVQVGEVRFLVAILRPGECAACGAALADGEGKEFGARLLCARCHPAAGAETVSRCVRPGGAVGCLCCGQTSRAEMPAGDDTGICRGCRAAPQRMAAALLAQAARGEAGAEALRGYRLSRELGRGGMGAVFLLEFESAGPPAALKLMLPHDEATGRALQVFLREIEVTRALYHPHIVRLLGSGTALGAYFYTMEYCEGGSVAGLVKSRGPLPVAEATPLVLQALDALDHMHGAGVVHRDLKPANLLLAGGPGGPLLKVADHGLAKAFGLAGLSGLTRTGDIAGTPHFMPRQQAIDFKYAGPEVDVWAAAASFYWMLSGATPRDFPLGVSPWLTILECGAAPIRQRVPSLPEPLARVIDQALTEEPRIGFQTAAELKEAIGRALAAGE